MIHMVRPLYPLGNSPAVTTLAFSFNAATSQILSVVDISSILTPPNNITIRDKSSFVTVSYSSVTGSNLSVSGVIAGDVNHTFEVGSQVVRTIDGYDFEAIHEALSNCVKIEETSSSKEIKFGTNGDNLFVSY